MARPSESERRRIEARKKANARLRDTEAERKKQADARVQQIISTALAQPRARDTLPDMHDLIERLWSAYDLAMASGQAKSAVDAVMAVGKLTGLLIDRSQSAIAVAGQIGVSGIGSQKFENIEEIVEDVRERLGERTAQMFLKTMEVMKRVFDEDRDATDDEIRQIRNGGANGVEQ
jgi:hypothetical protein